MSPNSKEEHNTEINSIQSQSVFTIQEMMDKKMLDHIPDVEISESEYNRIMHDSVEVDHI